jgi:Protein of unknown function (DUF3631)
MSRQLHPSLEADRPADNEEPQEGLCDLVDIWPEPVDGHKLLDDIKQKFSCYLSLPPGAADTLGLWTLHTYVFDVAEVTPRLAITSPEKRCGKTNCLRLLKAMCSRPLMAANITAAAVFRTVEMERPTLLIDEADTFLERHKELRGVLNSGHDPDGAVMRVVKDLPQQFSTFSPAAIACIGRLPATIGDRSIEIAMRRRKPSEDIARLRRNKIMEQCSELRAKCARWAADHKQLLADAQQDDPPEWLDDRAADNWGPLFAIADQAGSEWPERARTAARMLSAHADEEEAGSVKVTLLADIREAFVEHGDRIPSATLLSKLTMMAERPWREYSRGRPINERALSDMLRPFGIRPTQFKILGVKHRGYERHDFEDAFERYLTKPVLAVPIVPAVPDHATGGS